MAITEGKRILLWSEIEEHRPNYFVRILHLFHEQVKSGYAVR